MHLSRLLFGMALLAHLLLPGPHAAAQATGLTGDLPPDGIALAVWDGQGNQHRLASDAYARGCRPAALWLLVGGEFRGYIFGAPAFVNQTFEASYGASVPAGPVLLVCRVAAPAPLVLVPKAATDPLENALRRSVQSERTRAGLSMLVASPALDNAAGAYAALLLASGAAEPLPHGFDGREPWDRAAAAGYSSDRVAEILASQEFAGDYVPEERGAAFVQAQFLIDLGTRLILMNPQAVDIGVGCAEAKQGTNRTLLLCSVLIGER